MPIITFDDLLASLDVVPLDVVPLDAPLDATLKGDSRYGAQNVPMPYRRIFGGQLLAQTIAVATHSAAGKTVKSLHAIFPREGDLDAPLEFRVEALQDGRTFAGRHVVAAQGDRIIMAATVSLHVEDAAGGLEHQADTPTATPPDAAMPRDLSMIPWETRIVDDVDLAAEDVGPPRFEMWMRAPALPANPVIHQALFSHATDLTLIGTTLRPHPGISEAHSPERIQTAVTSHTLWFHRPIRLDDWVLLAQESPSAAGGRGFAWGHAYDRAGKLLASYAQESLIRRIG